MKKILSLLLAVVMVIGMLPAGAIFASAAEVSETMTITATSGTVSGKSISWISGNLTFTANQNTSSTAIRTSDSDHFRLYVGFSATLTCSAGNITKIVMESTGSSYAIDLDSDGTEVTVSGTTITIVPATSSDTYTISSVTKQTRVKSITVTYATGGDECAHANTVEVAAVAATCTNMGYTAGVQCTDCNVFITGHEGINALGHDWSDWAQTTAPGCDTEGEETSTCANCSESKTQAIEATGHTYVDGVCSGCGKTQGTAVATQITTADQFVSGEYVLVVSSGAAMGAYESGWVTAVQPEILDGAVLDAANGVWTLTVDGSSVTIVDANGVSIAPKGGNANGITSGDYSWAWSVNDDGTFVFAGVDTDTVQLASNTGSENKFRAYKTSTVSGNTSGYLANFAVYKMNEGGEVEPDPEEPTCEHTNTTTATVDATCTTAGSTTVTCADCGEVVSTEEIAALGHNYVDGTCTNCGEAETAEDANIVFELGDNGTASHADGSSATTYSETVNGYTLNITDGTKMYTKAYDATGNSCIKLGTSSAAGGFSFAVPDDVTKVIISVAGYKANSAKISINSGDTQTISTYSNNGEYTAIEIDTSTNKTISLTTISGGYRAMVNSITYVCAETNHTCVWGEGVVTAAATCTTDGVMTYTCTVDGCTKTEPIDATGHTYVYGESAITCSVCDYNAAYTLNTIAEAKAYTSTSQVYYIKGIVTYVSGQTIYMEDATGAVCVYFNEAPSDIALGDEILVWDTMTAYKGLIETSNTTSQEYVKVSSGNTLPSQTVTIADLNADSTNEYLGERVVIENVTMGVINASGNTPLTDADGNTINIYKVSGMNEVINLNDVVTVTAIVSTYNAYQLIINPGTAADDVVEVEHHDEVVIETVDIATAKAGTAGEYYQVEGVVTFIDGRNVYIQDATGGIVVYLTATNSTAAIGDKIKAYGQLKLYNGLIELDGIDQTNTEQFEVLSNGNTVEAQAVTVADVANDTTNEYLAEKITLNNVYVSYSYGYSSSYGNVNYILKDGESTVVLYRVPAATEADVMAGGTIINVEAIVSSYNGYQLRIVGIESITVVGACTHETTELVNVSAATCTEAGYTGDTECVACGNYTVRGEETAALGHNFVDGSCENCDVDALVAVYLSGELEDECATFEDALIYLGETGVYLKLLQDVVIKEVTLEEELNLDLNGHSISGTLTLNGKTLNVFDSSTDKYTCDEMGTFNCVDASGNPVVPASHIKTDVTGSVKRYMTIKTENGYTFHRFYMGITHMSLKPGTTSVGYKAIFAGDEMVQANVTSYGYTLQLEGNDAVNVTKSGSFVSGKAVTLRIDNFGEYIAEFGTTGLTASVTLTLNDGTVIESASVNKSMKDMVEAVNANFANYTAAQQTAVTAMVESYYEAMKTWSIANIYTPEVDGEVSEAEPVA